METVSRYLSIVRGSVDYSRHYQTALRKWNSLLAQLWLKVTLIHDVGNSVVTVPWYQDVILQWNTQVSAISVLFWPAALYMPGWLGVLWDRLTILSSIISIIIIIGFVLNIVTFVVQTICCLLSLLISCCNCGKRTLSAWLSVSATGEAWRKS